MATTDPRKIDLDFSPYFAGLESKTDEEATALEDRIEALPEPVKDFLFADATDDALRRIVEQAGLELRYGPAIAKVVLFTLLGDIPTTSIGTLLERLDIPTDRAQNVARSVVQLMEPVMAAKAQAVVGAKPREIPPMTRTVGGIIDLRKPPVT
jgi:hypothetical protein